MSFYGKGFTLQAGNLKAAEAVSSREQMLEWMHRLCHNSISVSLLIASVIY